MCETGQKNPKTTGKPVWLPPYITENLGARVISYNVPIYHHSSGKN